TLGSEKKTISFPVTDARYIRYRVISKDKGNTGIKEIQVSLNNTEKSKVEADLMALKRNLGNLQNLESSVTLPEVGEYGSQFVYTSTIPENFSNSGKVVRSDYTKNGNLKIVATLGESSDTASIPVSVKGTSTGGGGGGTSTGGGGGGGNNGGTGIAYPTNPQPTIAPDVEENSFKDVGNDHWAYSYIETLYKKNIVSGDDEGKFRPENNIVREEFLKMLLGSLGIKPLTTATADFTDVSTDDWSYAYIATGVETGIVNGISETEFGTGELITREDMAVLCERAIKYANKTLESVTTPIDFTDSEDISDYAKDSVKLMQSYGIINGYEGGFLYPKNNATRAEAAKMAYMMTK
ncbi:MAG: S-layer homology domain-containing protein, partial [Oscillospiraceae bacterium]